jgi:hypothetical protein
MDTVHYRRTWCSRYAGSQYYSQVGCWCLILLTLFNDNINIHAIWTNLIANPKTSASQINNQLYLCKPVHWYSRTFYHQNHIWWDNSCKAWVSVGENHTLLDIFRTPQRRWSTQLTARPHSITWTSRFIPCQFGWSDRSYTTWGLDLRMNGNSEDR